jgi:CYTH domain-containing protein
MHAKDKQGDGKTSPTMTFRRRFIIERLPGPVTPSDEHLQIFENYIAGTQLRLRSVRKPSTDERMRLIERVERTGRFASSTTAFLLGREEYEAMRPLRGREIRKNRYHFEQEDLSLEVDIFLGPLWGLNTATAAFESEAEAEEFVPPGLCLLEISEDTFFEGSNLSERNFEDVRTRFAKAKGES